MQRKASAECEADADRQSRVRAFTINGVQCGIPGVGQGAERLTFPRRYEVADALATEIWIRFATQAELAEDSTWYRRLEFRPGSIVHSNNIAAVPEDMIGLISTQVTVVAQEHRIVPPVAKATNVDLATVSTPPTPPPRF